jgi:hypothetical protein
MAILSSRTRIALAVAAGVAVLVLAPLAWLAWRSPTVPPQEPAPRVGPSASEPGRRASPLPERRSSTSARTPDETPVAEPDPTWDAETLALWQTVQDSALDDIVRESAALKLASRGDRGLLAKLWELWRNGRLPAGCSWLRDLMAAGAAGEDGAAAVGDGRPRVPAADVARAAGRAGHTAPPGEARLDAVRTLASAQTDEAVAILQGLSAGELAAPPELRAAAFAALLNVDDQLAVPALGLRLTQPQPPEVAELVAMLEALADQPHPGVRDIALPLLQHADADVREEAAWLLAVNSEETTAEDMRTVLQLLGTEEEPAVRRRLYAALDEGAAPYADGVLAALRAEEAVAVRLSGYQALASMAAAEPDGRVGPLFDSNVVGELTDTALNAPEYQYRFESVVVLKSARTAGATAALARIAAEASDARIAQAAAVP